MTDRAGMCGKFCLSHWAQKSGQELPSFKFSSEVGVSPKMINRVLREMNYKGTPKNVSVRTLLRILENHEVIAWYVKKEGDQGDHYVVVLKVEGNNLLLKDSEQGENPFWYPLYVFLDRWLRTYCGRRTGWIYDVEQIE